MAYEDLTGKRFGYLTVQRLAMPEEKKLKPGQGREWVCLCDCGNTTVVRTNYLNSGHTKSCGCLIGKTLSKNRLKDLTGQKFGRLTAIKRLDKKHIDGSYFWLCQCDCGNMHEAVSNHLLRGDVQSCGCLISRGENLIASILDKQHINYQRQYHFSDLRGKQNFLHFDFAIFDKQNNLQCLIEYQGEQHYTGPKGQFKIDIRSYDQQKREYCEKNNIPLIEIPYFDFSNITWEYLEKLIKIE